MEQTQEIGKNEEHPKNLIVCWPIRFRKRKHFHGWLGCDRWQMGSIKPHRVFRLHIFIGPLMVLTG